MSIKSFRRTKRSITRSTKKSTKSMPYVAPENKTKPPPREGKMARTPKQKQAVIYKRL